jgi:RsiW-degrading membrane proteinase PrsW (M82 family)
VLGVCCRYVCIIFIKIFTTTAAATATITTTTTTTTKIIIIIIIIIIFALCTFLYRQWMTKYEPNYAAAFRFLINECGVQLRISVGLFRYTYKYSAGVG